MSICDEKLENPSVSLETPARVAPLRRRSRRPIMWAVVVLVAALVIALLIARNNGLNDLIFPRAFRAVDDGQLYASGQINRRLIRGTLLKYHIQRIVSLSDDDPSDPDEQAERQAAAELGVSRVVYSLNGNGTGDIRHYEQTLVEVCRAKENHRPLLVHCYSGAQRSGGWIAFYRLLIQKRPANEAMAELRRSRWNDGRNPKLIEYVNSHMGEMARLLVARGLIDRVPDPLPQLAP